LFSVVNTSANSCLSERIISRTTKFDYKSVAAAQGLLEFYFRKKGGEIMPFVRVTSFPQTEEAREELAKGITEVVHKVTKIPPQESQVGNGDGLIALQVHRSPNPFLHSSEVLQRTPFWFLNFTGQVLPYFQPKSMTV